MKTINSWDELLDTSVDAILRDITFTDDFNFSKDIVLEIRICGASWNGFIDYRGAQFVIDLQNAVARIYSELDKSEISLRDLKKSVTVKVKIVEGSSIFQVKFEEIFKIMVANMSGTQTTLILGLGLLCTAGYLTIGKILEFKRSKMQKAQEMDLAKTYITRMSDTIDKAIGLIEHKDVQAPTRKLIDKLNDEDRIKLPGADFLNPEEAKELYPKKPKIRTESGYFDGQYVISAINMKKTPVQFELNLDGFAFWAKAQLDHSDIEKISRSLEVSMKENKELKVDLHLFVLFNERGFKSASIQATGEARDTSGDLKDKIAIWNDK